LIKSCVGSSLAVAINSSKAIAANAARTEQRALRATLLGEGSAGD
jgi:hypothetical protein